MKSRIGFFTDDNGNRSFKRLAGGFIIFTLMSVWAYVSVRNGTFTPIDTGAIITLLGVSADKTIQKIIERSQDKGAQDAGISP